MHALELMITFASNEESKCLMWRALDLPKFRLQNFGIKVKS